MHARSEALDLQKAALNPAAVFGTPKAIVEDARLSREQKLRLLKQWEHDALSLAVAEGEGMSGRRGKHAGPGPLGDKRGEARWIARTIGPRGARSLARGRARKAATQRCTPGRLQNVTPIRVE